MSGALTGLFAVDVGVSDGIQTVENNWNLYIQRRQKLSNQAIRRPFYERRRPGERTLEATTAVQWSM